MWQVLGIVLLTLCQSSYGSVICYSCSGTSAAVGQTCSYDRMILCDGSCQFSVAENGSWVSGCHSGQVIPPSPLTCNYDTTSKNTLCLCGADFCNDFDKIVDSLLEEWSAESVEIHMVFPSSMPMECFECGQVNVTGFGLITLPCDRTHTCHGDYCVTKRGDNPHSYCGTAWDGIPTVSCTKLPNQPEVCVCSESFCNPVLDQEPTTTTTSSPSSTSTTTSTATTTTSAAITTTTAPAATTTTTTTSPPVATTTNPKCKNGSFNPNGQAVSMGEKLKNIISNVAFNSVNLNWFQASIDEHICDYSATS